MLRKLLGYGVILAVVVALALLVLYRLGATKPEAVSIEKIHAQVGVPVQVGKPVRMDFPEYLLCDGSVHADARAFLRAKIGETVEAVNARVGEPVKKGQVLVEFRTTDLEASIQAAETAFEEAEKNYQRYQSLLEQRVISEDRVEQARTRRDSAAANLRAARSSLRFGQVESPIDGVVEYRWVEPGEYKGVGKELLSVVDLSTVEVAALVPERDVADLSIGREAEFQLESGQQWLKGHVSRISPSTTDPNRFFDVYLKVENKRTNGQWLMRPGMYAEVRFLRRTISGALAVAGNAIVRDGNVRAIYVVETRTEDVPVQPGAGPNPDSGDGGFWDQVKRGAARLRGAEKREEAAQQPLTEEREVSRARRAVVSTGLSRQDYVQITGAEVTEASLLILNPPDDIRDGTLVNVVEGGD